MEAVYEKIGYAPAIKVREDSLRFRSVTVTPR